MTQNYDLVDLIAAGGWVKNQQGDILWIHRLGCWDLPKGKLEAGESIPQCAVREVEEECGLSGVQLHEKLCETVHFYDLDGQRIRKTTHWFMMSVEGMPDLTAQSEEDIAQAVWASEATWKTYLEDSYDTIRTVASAYGNLTASGTKRV